MHRPGLSLVDVGKDGTKRGLIGTPEGRTHHFEYGANDVGSVAQY